MTQVDRKNIKPLETVEELKLFNILNGINPVETLENYREITVSTVYLTEQYNNNKTEASYEIENPDDSRTKHFTIVPNPSLYMED